MLSQGNKAEIDRQLVFCSGLLKVQIRMHAPTQVHRPHTHNKIKTRFLKGEEGLVRHVMSQPKTVSSVFLKHLGWPHDTCDNGM